MNNIIHVGLHKSGSTFLQSKIFPEIKNHIYLGFYNSNLLLEEVRYFQNCSNYSFNENKIKNLVEFINNCKNKNRNFLISSEAFTGGLPSLAYGTGVFIEMIAGRIKKYIPNPKIVLILRNQRDIICSSYKDDIQLGHTCNFDEWVKERLKMNSFEYYKYDKMVSYYQNIFGKNNVLVYLYEEVFDSPEGMQNFLKDIGLELKISDHRISQTMMKKINISNSNLITKLTRFINHFIKTKVSQGYNDGNYNLPLYNFWRYHLSKKLSLLIKSEKKYLYNKHLDKFLLTLNDNNERLFQQLNRNPNKNYFFE